MGPFLLVPLLSGTPLGARSPVFPCRTYLPGRHEASPCRPWARLADTRPPVGRRRTWEGIPMAAAWSLPTETVTFLFTDIESSTRLWEEHPGAMRRALARHDALLRQVIRGHRGH